MQIILRNDFSNYFKKFIKWLLLLDLAKMGLRLREGRDVGSRTQTIWEPETRGPARCLVMSRTQEPLGTGGPKAAFCLGNQSWDAAKNGLAWGDFRKGAFLHQSWTLSCYSSLSAEQKPALQTSSQILPACAKELPLLWTRKRTLVKHHIAFRTWGRLWLSPELLLPGL